MLAQLGMMNMSVCLSSDHNVHKCLTDGSTACAYQTQHGNDVYIVLRKLQLSHLTDARGRPSDVPLY
jgi:hypothetical protein